MRDDGAQALVTAHAFDLAEPLALQVTLPQGVWRLSQAFHSDAVTLSLDGHTLRLNFSRPCNGVGVLRERLPD